MHDTFDDVRRLSHDVCGKDCRTNGRRAREGMCICRGDYRRRKLVIMM